MVSKTTKKTSEETKMNSMSMINNYTPIERTLITIIKMINKDMVEIKEALIRIIKAGTEEVATTIKEDE
jgi:hypothetical protein